MTDPTIPSEPPQPVQPFVPGKRPKKPLKPLGPIRRAFVKVPPWLFALILCVPALAFTAVKQTPVPLKVTVDVLLLAALFFTAALRRGRFKHVMAMLGWLLLVFAANVVVGLVLGLFQASTPWVGPTLDAVFGEFIEYGWLVGGVITVLMIGLGEMFCTARRSWPAVFWLVVASVLITAASTLIHEALFRTGLILAPMDAWGEGRYDWVGPVFATIRAVLTWLFVPLAVRIASKGTTRQRLGFGLTTGVLLVAYAVFFLVLPIAPPSGLTVSKETTLLTGPLNPSGTVNYIDAINREHGEGITLENNAAIPLLQTVGPDGIISMLPSERDCILRRLGAQGVSIDEKAEQFQWRKEFHEHLADELQSQSRPSTRMAEALQELLDHFGEPDDLEAVLARKPWRADEQPALAAYIRRMEKPLARFVEASRRSRYWMPLISETDPPTFVDIHWQGVGHVMSMTNTIAARAMLKLGNDDVDGAIEDVLAMHRIARLMAQGASRLEFVVGYAVDAFAAKMSTALARSGKVSVPQLRRLIRDVLARGPLREVDRAMGYEMYQGLDCVDYLNRGGPPDGTQQIALKKQIDWDEMLRVIRFWQERVSEEWLSDDYRPHEGESTVAEAVSVDGAAGRAQERYQPVMWPWHALRAFTGGSRTTRVLVSRAIGELLIEVAVPASGYDRFQAHKGAALRELGIIALAIETYRLEKGRLPKSLADLVPGYLPRLPSVQLGKHPPRYVVHEDGTYTLQSTQWRWDTWQMGSLELGKRDLVPDDEQTVVE